MSTIGFNALPSNYGAVTHTYHLLVAPRAPAIYDDPSDTELDVFVDLIGNTPTFGVWRTCAHIAWV
jgi:hypothetical protein